MTDFNAAAATWDDDPVKVERARATAAAIGARVPIPPDANGFEYGCGTGLLGVALADRFAHLTLADNAPGMLAVLGEKLRARGLAHLEPLEIDLEHAAPPARRYEVVFTSMALHHVRNVPTVLRAFAALTAPGGHVAIADLDTEDGSFHGPEVDVHHGFDRDALGRDLVAAGFVAPQFTTVIEIPRPTPAGERLFPVFLAVARR